ncbi:hypothetical protein JCM3775_005646 [Rhodotorula graminis]
MTSKLTFATVDTLATTFATTLSMHLAPPSTSTPKSLDYKLRSVPLVGNWSVTTTRHDTFFELSVSTDAATVGYEPLALHLTVRLNALLDDHDVLPIAHGNLLPPHIGQVRLVVSYDKLRELEAASDGRYSAASHRAYDLRFEVNVHQGVPLVHPQTLVRRLPDESDRPTRDAVAFLSASSPYFKTLLRSGFSESVRKASKRARTSASARSSTTVEDGDKNFADSDDETDVALCEDKASPLSLHDVSNHADLSYQEIVVRQTAYSTYSAVLRYFQTGFLRFAPLASSCLPVLASAKKSRADLVKELRAAQPSLPIPVSPKSTYRLAHLLGCEPLQQACLAEFGRQLSVDNAALELFDNASQVYAEWRKVALAYVVREWGRVKASDSWRDLQARIARDEIPGAAPILMELLSARGRW